MIWFKCGEAYRERRQHADTLANFRQAGQLFTKEWRELAISEAKVAEKQIPRGLEFLQGFRKNRPRHSATLPVAVC